MKTIRLTIAAFVLGVLLPGIATSCPVCFGDKASAEVEGAKWAILFLLGVTGTVLGGVASFIIYLHKRTKAGSIQPVSHHLNREL